MTPTTARLFREHVLATFKAACDAFANDPGSIEWVDLKAAMWAWQHVQALPAEQLKDAATKYLFNIAEHAKGDRNFGESA